MMDIRAANVTIHGQFTAIYSMHLVCSLGASNDEGCMRKEMGRRRYSHFQEVSSSGAAHDLPNMVTQKTASIVRKIVERGCLL